MEGGGVRLKMGGTGCVCVSVCVTTGGCGAEAARWCFCVCVCVYMRVCVCVRGSVPAMHKGVERGAAGLCPRPPPPPPRFVPGVPSGVRRAGRCCPARGGDVEKGGTREVGGDRAAPGEAGGMGWRCDSRRLAAEAALLLPPFPPDLPPRIAALLGGRRAAISIIIAITVFIRGAGVRCGRTPESLLRSRELLPAPPLPYPKPPSRPPPAGRGAPGGRPRRAALRHRQPPAPASIPVYAGGGGTAAGGAGGGTGAAPGATPGPGPRTAARPRAARGFPEPGETPAAAAAGAAGGCCNPRQPPQAAVRCGSSPLPGMNPPAVLSRLRSSRLLGCQARVAQFIAASC